MNTLPILIGEIPPVGSDSAITAGFIFAIAGVALAATLVVSLMNYYCGDPNALLRSSHLKNSGLGFLAAAVSGVLFILLAEAHFPKLPPTSFLLVIIGSGVIGLFSSFVWFQLLVTKGGRLDNFAESDFGEPNRPKRRWEN